MKTKKILIAASFAILALAAYSISNTGPVRIAGTPIASAPSSVNAIDMRDAGGILHQYYIGLHGPGQKCFTKAIKAQSLSEAVRKGIESCRECAVYDLTPSFAGKGNNVFADRNTRYCPLYIASE